MSNTQSHYSAEVKTHPGRKISITLSIPWEEVAKEEKGALATLGAGIEVKGFRKGKAPEDVIRKHIGEARLHQEMAERTLSRIYPLVLKEHELDTIGAPHIHITKLAAGNPFEVNIETYLMPDITLPDYVKEASEVVSQQESVEVKDADVDEAINHIREQWAKSEKYGKLQDEAEEGERINPENITVEKEEWPELDDDFVKKLGDFKDVSEFKGRLKENIGKEKEMRGKEKLRAQVLEAIVEKSKGEIPTPLVEAELTKMLAQFEADVERAGAVLDEYLKEAGKTRDDLKKEWREDAEKRAKTQLVLNAIAEKETIEPDMEKIEEETKHLLKHYPEAKEGRVRLYVANMLQNTAVIDFLTGDKDSEYKKSHPANNDPDESESASNETEGEAEATESNSPETSKEASKKEKE